MHIINKQWVIPFLLVPIILVAGCSGWNPDKSSNTSVDESEVTIARFKKMDPSLNTFFNKAYAFAVFPNIGKGAIVIGGAYGKGKVYRNGRVIGSTSMTQVTVGAQLGGQGYSELIFFKDQAAFDQFKSENLKFDAQVSAVAVKYGGAASASYSKGVAVFVMTKAGLMFEASVGGQAFTYTPNP
jgi:lipid-binding SYLF domain-containing protein